MQNYKPHNILGKYLCQRRIKDGALSDLPRLQPFNGMIVHLNYPEGEQKHTKHSRMPV